MSFITRFKHRHEKPMKIEGGVAYYPNRSARRALREVERAERGEIELEEYVPLASGNIREGKDYLYEVTVTAEFKRGVKRMMKRNADMSLLDRAIDILGNGGTLPPSYRDHPLDGRYNGRRECHIRPDWLLEYSIDCDELKLLAIRTVTHSDLYDCRFGTVRTLQAGSYSRNRPFGHILTLVYCGTRTLYIGARVASVPWFARTADQR